MSIREEMDKVASLMNPDLIKRKSKIDKRIQFGHQFNAYYTKHFAAVKNIFWNQSLRCFVSYNQKGIHVWQAQTEEQQFYANMSDSSLARQLSCLVYSSDYHLYFGATYDFKLVVLNE